jgi:rhodanese-related sulfurtransferase
MEKRLKSQILKNVAGAVLIGACAAVVGCQDSVSDKDISRIGLGEVQRLSKEKGDKVMLLDPRPANQFAAGHLPGAVNVPLEQIPSEKGQLAPALLAPKYVVVYGTNPGDGYAIAATKRLMRAGQGGARLFPGGVSEWQGAGLKVDSPAPVADPKPK